MSNEVVIHTPQVAVTPHQRHWTEDQKAIDVIKNTVAKGTTDFELQFFLATCHRTGLDPLARQIHCVKRWDAQAQKEVMAIQAGIDGYRLIAERTGKYSGQHGPFWCGPDEQWKDVWISDQPPTAAKVGIVRSDFAEPVWAVALYSEYCQTKKDGHPNHMWAKMPANQLAKCAESLALRKAFPLETSGTYTTEEMGQADSEAPQQLTSAPQRKSAQAGTQVPADTPELTEAIGAFKKKDREGKLNWLLELERDLAEATGSNEAWLAVRGKYPENFISVGQSADCFREAWLALANLNQEASMKT